MALFSCNCQLRSHRCEGCETRNPRNNPQREISDEDEYEAELKVKAAKKLLEEKEAALAAAKAEEAAVPKAPRITLDEIEAENSLKLGRPRAEEAATSTSMPLIDPDFDAMFASPSAAAAPTACGVWDPFGETTASVAPPRSAAHGGDLLDLGFPSGAATFAGTSLLAPCTCPSARRSFCNGVMPGVLKVD